MSETLCSIQSAQTQKFVSIDGSHLPEVPVVTAGFPNWIHIRPPPEGRVTFAKVQSPSSLYACPAKELVGPMVLVWGFEEYVWKIIETDLGYVLTPSDGKDFYWTQNSDTKEIPLLRGQDIYEDQNKFFIRKIHED